MPQRFSLYFPFPTLFQRSGAAPFFFGIPTVVLQRSSKASWGMKTRGFWPCHRSRWSLRSLHMEFQHVTTLLLTGMGPLCWRLIDSLWLLFEMITAIDIDLSSNLGRFEHLPLKINRLAFPKRKEKFIFQPSIFRWFPAVSFSWRSASRPCGFSMFWGGWGGAC